MNRTQTGSLFRLVPILTILLSCSIIGTVHAQDAVEMKISNQTGSPIEYFWINFQGKEQSYGKLNAGDSANLSTFVGHEWVFRDVKTGKEVGRATAAKNTKEYVVKAPGLKPNDRAELVLTNSTRGTVEVFWITFEGTEKSYGKLKPGEQMTRITGIDQSWIVRDADGKEIQRVKVTKVSDEVVIKGGQAPPPPNRATVTINNQHSSQIAIYTIIEGKEQLTAGIGDAASGKLITDLGKELVIRDSKSSKELQRFKVDKLTMDVTVKADSGPAPQDRAAVTFNNQRSSPITIYTMVRGKEQLTAGINKGASVKLDTDLGKELVIRDDQGKEIQRVKIDKLTMDVVVKADDKGSGGSGGTKVSGLLTPIDADKPNPTPTIVVHANADDSVDVAWLTSDGKTYISTFSGRNWQDANSREIKQALNSIGGFTRDDIGNTYLVTTVSEKVAEADSKNYRKNVAHLLKFAPGKDTPEVIDLNTKEISTKCAITNPIVTERGHAYCASRLVHGNGELALAFAQNNDGTHSSSKLTAFTTSGKSLYGDGGYSQHCADLRLIFDGSNFVMAQVFEAGVGLSKLTRDGDKLKWSDHILILKNDLRHLIPEKDWGHGGCFLRFGGLVATKDGYTLVCSYGPGTAIWNYGPSEWSYSPKGTPLVVVTVPKDFETLKKFDWIQRNPGPWLIPDAPGTTRKKTLVEPASDNSNFVRSRIVDLKNGKYIVLWEQRKVQGAEFEKTMALVMDAGGNILQNAKELPGARLQCGAEAVYLPKSGKAAWVSGEAKNRKMVLYTLDESLNLSSHDLQTP